jgi:molybdopterin-guanine dinucleotide biosynthesis protein A
VTGDWVTSDGECAGFVLAGGASSRFGRDKALAHLGGKPVLARLCAMLGEAVSTIAIVGDPKKYAASGVKCIADRWPGEGPLGGIVTALDTSAQNATAEAPAPGWNLIIGCDMPFLTREWLTYLIQRALASLSDVVVPKSILGLEPLCACWRTAASTTLRQAFDQGTRKVSEAMKHLRMEILDEPHWKRFDSAGRLFWNMNTPADYEEARRLVEAVRS